MPPVGKAAYALGFAGLLPAFAAACLLALGRPEAVVIAFLYPGAILSFLGGIWWGFAMRRETGQGTLAAIAVVPSLVAVAAVVAALILAFADVDPVLAGPQVGWTLAVLGVAIILTLLVDRHLVATGEVPAGWMRLRVPLSLGLGGLTIVSAVLVARL